MYIVLKIISKVFCLLPFNISLTCGKILAQIAWLFIPSHRKKLSRENIQSCLNISEVEAEKISKAAALQFGPMLIEVLCFPKLKSEMKNHVKVIGLNYLTDYINSAEREGRGAVIMTSHSDNWELMGGAYAQYGIPLVGVAKKQREAGADKFVNEYRTLIGMHITYKSGVREMYRMMDEGHFIGLIMDQDVGRHDGAIVKFFNRASTYMTGAAAMSRLKKVPIFPAFMHKNSDDTHTLEIFPPLYCEKTSDKRKDIQQMTQKLATLTEEHIKKYPQEWFWLHDRWKTMRTDFTPEEVAQLNENLGIENEELKS